MLIEGVYANLTDDDKERLRNMVGPSPTRALTGATLERLPVQYEVEINDATRVVVVKTYNAQLDDAEEIAEFVDRLTRRLWELREGDGE